MRIACLFLVAACLCSGCAPLIARSGTDLTELKTKQDVRTELGKPSATGVTPEGYYEEYRTHQKIAEPYAWRYCGPGYGMLLYLTFGTADLVMVPYELYLTGRRSLLGQTIRVRYNAHNEVVGLKLDDEGLFLLGGESEIVAPQLPEEEDPSIPDPDVLVPPFRRYFMR